MVANGNFGDTEPVSEGISELSFFFGPSYRIYYCKQGQRAIIFLQTFPNLLDFI
jgi:putative addiction module killer protein